MADKNDKSSGEHPFSNTDSQKAKRPTATLELEATEIKQEKDKSSQNQSKKELPGSNGNKAGSSGVFGEEGLSGVNIASGVVGGVLVLMLFWLGSYILGGSSGGDSSSAVVVLNTRLDELDNRLKKATAGESGAGGLSIEKKLKQLETKITAIAGSTKDNDGSHVAEAAAIANLLTEMEASFEKKLEVLRGQLEGLVAEKLNKASADIKKSIPLGTTASGKLNSEIIRELVQENSSVVIQDMDAIKKRNAELAGKIQSYDKIVAQLQQHITEQNNVISALQAQTVNRSGVNSAIDPVAQRVAVLEKKVSEVVTGAEEEKKGARNTALSLAFSGLKKAADRGESFEAEVKAFKELVPQDNELAQLGAFQGTGAPTLRTLEAGLKPLIQKVLKADRQPKTSSLWEKFSVNAASLVRFRRTGNIPGNTTEAILARVEFNINKGDYKKALQEGQGLQGHAQTEAESWLKGLEHRLKLNEVLQKVEVSLLSRLGSGSGSQRRDSN
ncbi:MAG: hypothetical protein ACRBBN_21905 [Methyloligellaceae bacterium]